MEKLIQEYFEAFSKKDIVKLAELYDDNIVLSEWNENMFSGKAEVIQANLELFWKFDSINITILSTGIDQLHNISLNEILVNLDGQLVRVVDVIKIMNNKIQFIMAYRGF